MPTNNSFWGGSEVGGVLFHFFLCLMAPKQINTIQVHRWNLDNFITLYNILISPYFSNTYFWFLAQFEFSGIFYAISYDISKDKSKDLVQPSKFSLIILSIPSPPLFVISLLFHWLSLLRAFFEKDPWEKTLPFVAPKHFLTQLCKISSP